MQVRALIDALAMPHTRPTCTRKPRLQRRLPSSSSQGTRNTICEGGRGCGGSSLSNRAPRVQRAASQRQYDCLLYIHQE